MRVDNYHDMHEQGRWTVSNVLDAITRDTCMVTMMLANNETGFIQPVKELFTTIKKNPPKTLCPIILHTDAAQAIGKIPVNVDDLGADMLTVVGHKFYGPRIGCLYHRSGVSVTPMFFGGGQEAGLRPGTENTPMIVGLGVAAQLVSENIQSSRTTILGHGSYLIPLFWRREHQHLSLRGIL